MENDENKYVEWAHELQKKLPKSKDISIPRIVLMVCQEEKKTGDMETAKVKVANKLLNGR